MIEPRIPSNEKKRLKELYSYDILDSDAENDYDVITRLACSIFDTPISAITLIDKDRQWFKSKVGMDISETSRNISFCGHAINDAENVTVVEDTRLDSRFKENPFVKNDPNIVFYAGAPLISSEGLPLGTLCVIDYKTHQFNQSNQESLKSLAAQVMHLFELRKKNTELELRNHEKSILLKEIHHRVKNNLQIISSLLNLQINQSLEPSASKALQTSRARIMAMSLIHQQLYQGDSLETVNFKTYLKDLLKSIKEIYSDITTSINVDELEFSLDLAVPLSLITSEFITNAFKHAFKEKKNKQVKISIIKIENNLYQLIISDNGIGFNKEEKWIRSQSLGFEIAKTLTEQINGKIECITSKSGSEFKILFPVK